MHDLVKASLAVAVLLVTVTQAGADLAEVKARRTLRVLYVSQNTAIPGESPFFTVKGGKPTGFDAELIERFCTRHAVRMEVLSVAGHQAALAALASGQADVLAGNITVTDARRKVVEFTSEVLPTRFVIVSRRPHQLIQSLDEFRSARVGTTAGTSRHEATLQAQVPPENIVQTLAIDGVPEALKSGSITAAILEIHAALVLKERDPELQLGMFLGPPQSLAWAVRKGDAKLLEALNEHIGSARVSPAWLAMLSKHFGGTANAMLQRVRQ